MFGGGEPTPPPDGIAEAVEPVPSVTELAQDGNRPEEVQGEPRFEATQISDAERRIAEKTDAVYTAALERRKGLGPEFASLVPLADGDEFIMFSSSGNPRSDDHGKSYRYGVDKIIGPSRVLPDKIKGGEPVRRADLDPVKKTGDFPNRPSTFKTWESACDYSISAAERSIKERETLLDEATARLKPEPQPTTPIQQ